MPDVTDLTGLDNYNLENQSSFSLQTAQVRPIQITFFKKNGPFPASFYLFSSFQYTVDSKQMSNNLFADDWIRTADLWYWKRPLYQLSHTTTALVTEFLPVEWICIKLF